MMTMKNISCRLLASFVFLLLDQGLFSHGSRKNVLKYRQMNSHKLSSHLAGICIANERFYQDSPSYDKVSNSCDFLEKIISCVKTRGSSLESYGLGWLGAFDHFEQQDPETQSLIVSVHKGYRAFLPQRNEKEAAIKEHIHTVLSDGEQAFVDREVVDREMLKLRKLGDNLAREYGERLIAEKRFEELEDEFAALTE